MTAGLTKVVWGWIVAQAVGYLPSKHKALSSNPNSTKKEKGKKKKRLA
jgi:hypothetical protein